MKSAAHTTTEITECTEGIAQKEHRHLACVVTGGTPVLLWAFSLPGACR